MVLPSSKKLFIAGTIFITGFLSPLLIPVVTSSNLSTGWKATLSGLLAIGILELFMVQRWFSPEKNYSISSDLKLKRMLALINY